MSRFTRRAAAMLAGLTLIASAAGAQDSAPAIVARAGPAAAAPVAAANVCECTSGQPSG